MTNVLYQTAKSLSHCEEGDILTIRRGMNIITGIVASAEHYTSSGMLESVVYEFSPTVFEINPIENGWSVIDRKQPITQ